MVQKNENSQTLVHTKFKIYKNFSVTLTHLLLVCSWLDAQQNMKLQLIQCPTKIAWPVNVCR